MRELISIVSIVSRFNHFNFSFQSFFIVTSSVSMPSSHLQKYIKVCNNNNKEIVRWLSKLFELFLSLPVH